MGRRRGRGMMVLGRDRWFVVEERGGMCEALIVEH